MGGFILRVSGALQETRCPSLYPFAALSPWRNGQNLAHIGSEAQGRGENVPIT